MMAEYGSAFHDAKGGIYSWLAGSIGEKWAFIGTFVWLANWVLWLVSSASRLWISISALIFGKDTTQSWDLFGLRGTPLNRCAGYLIHDCIYILIIKRDDRN